MDNNIKEENDQLLIEFLNEYEELTILRQQFNDNLKNGYFLISKSKYSMGQKSLGELQYPENIKPLFNVLVEKSDYDFKSKDDLFLSLQIKNINNSSNNNTDQSSKNNNNKEIINNKSSSGTTTRRRNVNTNEPKITNTNGLNTMGSLEALLRNTTTNDNSDDSSDDSSDDDSDESEDDTDDDNSNKDDKDDEENIKNNSNLTKEEKDNLLKEKLKKQQQKKKLKENKKIIRKDPLYWFGISTPSSLKQSQNHFKQAIKQSIEISNKLIKLDIIFKKYCDLNTLKIEN